MNTMISSSKVFTDEAAKMQETWVKSVEKQMDLLKNFCPDLSKQAGTKK